MFNSFTTPNILKPFKFSQKDSKLTPSQHQQPQQQPEQIFLEPDLPEQTNTVTEKSTTQSEIILQEPDVQPKPIRPHLKKIREKIWLKQRPKIKFFYCGSTILSDLNPVGVSINQSSPTEPIKPLPVKATNVKDGSTNTCCDIRDATTQTSNTWEQFDQAFDYLEPQFIEVIFQEIEFNVAREMVAALSVQTAEPIPK